MSVEYDSDNFDMEQVSGVDNPVEPGDSYDAGVGNEARANVPSRKPKAYTVYGHCNLTNGKWYVGMTSQEPKKRWNYGWKYKEAS